MIINGKKYQLQEMDMNTPIQMISGIQNIKIPTTPAMYRHKPLEYIEKPRFQTKIVTDGMIRERHDVSKIDMHGYTIGGELYYINHLKSEVISFTEANFIIQFLITEDWMSNGNVTGWFEVIKQASIYLGNKQDKDIKRIVKYVMKKLTATHVNDVKSVWDMLIPKEPTVDVLEYKDNVYQVDNYAVKSR